jgi:mono/diheme cytochrome c family protein
VQLKPSWRHALGVSVAVWATGLVTAGATPQTTTAPPRPASTGVYSATQAARGRALYGDNCQGCHNIASQSGESFAKKWRGAALSDLFLVLTDDMPKDAPGSLAPAERADIIAYMLKLNEFAAGNDDLPGDLDQLKKIVIDLPGGGEKN